MASLSFSKDFFDVLWMSCVCLWIPLVFSSDALELSMASSLNLFCGAPRHRSKSCVQVCIPHGQAGALVISHDITPDQERDSSVAFLQFSKPRPVGQRLAQREMGYETGVKRVRNACMETVFVFLSLMDVQRDPCDTQGNPCETQGPPRTSMRNPRKSIRNLRESMRKSMISMRTPTKFMRNPRKPMRSQRKSIHNLRKPVRNQRNSMRKQKNMRALRTCVRSLVDQEGLAQREMGYETGMKRV